MLSVRHTLLGAAAAAGIALLPMAPAMAHGHGFRASHSFGVGHGLVGAAVALATLPLVIASNVVTGISEAVAGNGYGYAPPVTYAAQRPYYAPYPSYYPRPYYAGHARYDGRGYHRASGHPYPRR